MSFQSVKNLATDLKSSSKFVNVMIFECINSIKEEIIEFDEEAESIEYLRASSNISAEANGSVNISRVLR